jgi:hypothetical protein
MYTSVADPGSSAFFLPGSGNRIRDEFFPDLGSGPFYLMKFSHIILRILDVISFFSLTGLLLQLNPETVSSKKKIVFFTASANWRFQRFSYYMKNVGGEERGKAYRIF